MKKYLILFLAIFISSCNKNYTPEEVSNSYCDCVAFSEYKKKTCILDWAVKYKGALKTKEEHKKVNYNMIECNGFEGDNDFYLKLMRN